VIEAWRVRREFEELFTGEPRLFAAPGRVNLIGEHTDYNDGFVLPAAIDRQTVVAARARNDRVVRVHSTSAGETVQFNLDEPGAGMRQHWLDYVEGVARCLEDTGIRLVGADLLVRTDVPDGAGLSSSAAFEISTGLALQTLSGVPLDRVKLALAAQRAEHTYVGVMCGIMDQFISALGVEGHALLIDCRSLHATPVPMEMSDVDLVICNTGVKHALADSEYNKRRAECEQGVELLRAFLPGIQSLRDVTPGELDVVESRLPYPIRQRCRHVVHENARTLQAADALRRGELVKMGLLMARSHRSLRDDYEVSSSELNALVEIANQCPGVYGARMTGGGFGGCTVNLMPRSARKGFVDAVSCRYYHANNIAPAIYVTRICGGAHEIT
jgi:galactokinase